MGKSLDPPEYVDKWISWTPQLTSNPMENPTKEKRGKETGTKIGTRRKGKGFLVSRHSEEFNGQDVNKKHRVE
jgi:hypothetical protein